MCPLSAAILKTLFKSNFFVFPVMSSSSSSSNQSISSAWATSGSASSAAPPNQPREIHFTSEVNPALLAFNHYPLHITDMVNQLAAQDWLAWAQLSPHLVVNSASLLVRERDRLAVYMERTGCYPPVYHPNSGTWSPPCRLPPGYSVQNFMSAAAPMNLSTSVKEMDKN